jgi:G3E family GTPase
MAAFAERSAQARLPITIVTGFLGSGKTTLVNHILTNQRGLRTGVIVNDLNEIDIDGELIVSANDGMVELSNGCICCSLNNNLIDGVFRLLDRSPPPNYLIVETTGVADPLPIALTFLRTELRDRVRLDSIVTVADAENFGRCDSQAARNQLSYGDVVLLNKCDLVDRGRLGALERAIREVAGRARIIRSVRCEVPLALILSVGLFQSDRFFAGYNGHDAAAAAGVHDHLNTDGFESISFQSHRPFAVRPFQDFLVRLPDNVYRGKGLLWIAETEKRYIFHLVGKRFSLDEAQSDTRRENKLVLIGRNLDQPALSGALEGCLCESRQG